MSNQSLAIVIVTYKRNELLKVLFDSFVELTVKPQAIFVVDNDASEETKALCADLKQSLGEQTKVNWIAMKENTGGSGGFSCGVKEAYDAGYEWFWLMDDDVAVLPDAIEKLQPWMDKALEQDHRALQCSKINFTGEPFYWQYSFSPKLCMLNPFSKSSFEDGEDSKPMTTICFEGGLIHRSVVDEIGYPDPRFFIHFDDTCYGYLASKVTDSLLISDVIMRRTRETQHMRVGNARKLNVASDSVRYRTMRNRGYLARYAQLNGEYNPLTFAVGTQATFLMEGLRLVIANNAQKKTGAAPTKGATSKSIAELRRGARDARAIIHDKSWEPMPKPGE